MKNDEKEYLDALKKVKEYQIKINKLLIVPLTCVCCKINKVEPLDDSFSISGTVKATEQEKECWNKGTVIKASFGYGSSLDSESFYCAICDDCAKQLSKDGLIIDYKKLSKKEKDLYNQ